MCNTNQHITKQCRVCAQSKPVELFRRCGKTKAGIARYDSICKECQRDVDAKYRAGLNQDQKERYRLLFLKHNKAKSEARPKKTDVWFHECVRCGRIRLLVRYQRTKRCDECADRAKNYQRPIPVFPVGTERECAKCKQKFLVSSKNQSLCSEACRQSQERMWSRNDKRRRRNAKKIVGAVEKVIDVRVFARDKWRCCACGIKVHKKDVNAMDAAEMDHIIPIAKGGVETYSNVQTLCRQCNQSKSDKLVGQMVLQM